jgi:hypothetical protein
VSGKPYTARSITGAQDYVRRLLKVRDWYEDYCTEQKKTIERLNQEANLLAKLGTTGGPCFYQPNALLKAQELRDRRLAAMGLNPDGSCKDGSSKGAAK